jgi:hypothetical protein
MEDEDFTSDAKSGNRENDDGFDKNFEENDSAHSSEDDVDDAELVKTFNHLRQVSCFYTSFFLLISIFSFNFSLYMGQPALCHFVHGWMRCGGWCMQCWCGPCCASFALYN